MNVGNWRHIRRQYAVSFLFFILFYGTILAIHGTLPRPLIGAVLLLAFAKDLADEWRMRHGGDALAYRRVEHNPSNVILLLLFATGTVPLTGATLGVSDRLLFPAVTAIDLLFDGSQDLRT